MFNAKQPLWLPQGSIRALLALVLVCASVGLAFAGLVSPDKIVELAVIVVGFYFATRPQSPAQS